MRSGIAVLIVALVIGLVLVSGCLNIFKLSGGAKTDTQDAPPPMEEHTEEITAEPTEEFAQTTQALEKKDEDVLELVPLRPDPKYQAEKEREGYEEFQRQRHISCQMECENAPFDKYLRCVRECEARITPENMFWKWKCCKKGIDGSFWSESGCINACGGGCVRDEMPCPEKFECCHDQVVYDSQKECEEWCLGLLYSKPKCSPVCRKVE